MKLVSRAEGRRRLGCRDEQVPLRLEILVEVADQPLEVSIPARGQADLLAPLIGPIVFDRRRGRGTGVGVERESGETAVQLQEFPDLLRPILAQILVAAPVRARRGEIREIEVVTELEAADADPVLERLTEIERLIIGESPGIAVDEAEAALRELLVHERGLD